MDIYPAGTRIEVATADAYIEGVLAEAWDGEGECVIDPDDDSIRVTVYSWMFTLSVDNRGVILLT